jgi:molybdate transport system substrate-binding protein
VAAAISLQEALGQVFAEFALEKPASPVRVIYGATNELADHILAGAPCDLFIAAEPDELLRLKRSGLLRDGMPRRVATNGLAVVGRARFGLIRKPADFLANRVKRIALAEPACPLGRYSIRYLRAVGIYDSLLSKVLHVDNSRAVLAAVVSQAADVGLVFSSDAARRGAWHRLFRAPQRHAGAVYEASIVGSDPHPGAAVLLRFLESPAAAHCFRRCGLGPGRAEKVARRSPRKKSL